MVTLDMIRKPVEGDLEAFEQFIRQKFTADGTLLSEMLDYALSARGKGIRPMTVLLSAALNAPAGQRSGRLRTLLAATLVEMIHVASLIHDDVIDESDMRRGRASVNARWQSRNAVVVGDYILAKNMDLGLKSGPVRPGDSCLRRHRHALRGRDSAKRQGEPAGDDAGVVPGYHLQENRLPDRGERFGRSAGRRCVP